MALRALPSSSSTCGWTYDVFLSFRGEDTRMTFTSHLYNLLDKKGIRTFFDDEELERGDEIRPSLVKAIKESRMAIIVFSKNYASSTFCLDELVTIFEHIKGEHRLVWPIFYDVDPSEISHCRGSFKDSLAKHEERFKDDKEKVLKWRFALQKAANLSGDPLKSGHEYEHQFIGKIVEEVSRKVNHNPLHVAANPVGLFLPMMEVIWLLELELDDKVKMVGIYGIGGIGKSTIARAVYNKIASQFDGICFLDDVRAHGLVQMQEKLLSNAVGERYIQLESIHKGIPIIKRRLQNKKILLVLDNVDKLKQLQCIAGGRDWFGYGSRIIITTRDKHLLACHGVDRVYEVMELNHENALKLFSWNAFKSHEIDPNFKGLSNRIVRYAGGLPLALEVTGSDLFGRGIEEWRAALNKYKSIPLNEIHEVLKVSYDGLGDEEKEVFLDIACFFKMDSFLNVKAMLNACGFHADYCINVLIDKCLLEIDSGYCMTMHDLIKSMGKEIVRQESKKDVGKRSRLWSYKDIVHVLEENRGSDKIEVIILDPPKEIKVHWNGKAFKKMKNLRILIIRNTCFSRRIKYLPKSLKVLVLWKCTSSRLGPVLCDFHGLRPVILDLSYTCFRWDKPLQKFSPLTLMDFTGCDSLQQIPDLSRAPNLKELVLDKCVNLIEIHKSVGLLKKLETLSAESCHNLSIFPPAINLPSLKYLNLTCCCSLQSFPNILEENVNKLYINLGYTAIEELPPSIVKLKGLSAIDLHKCQSLNRVPGDILMLPGLLDFYVESSTRFHFFGSNEDQEKDQRMPLEYFEVTFKNCGLKDDFLSPRCVLSFYHVTHFYLNGSSFKVLPLSFTQCCSLKRLCLMDCKQLQEIEGIPPNILYLSAQRCTSLSSQSSSMLVRQVLLKTGRFFILPRKNMQEWFDYACKDETITFWLRKKVPVITLCFVLKDYSRLHFIMRINGSEKFRWSPHNKSSFSIRDHWGDRDHQIFYNLDLVLLWDEVRLLEPEWSCVEINLEGTRENGVYVNKQETSMEDIRFEDPHFFPLQKKQGTLSVMGASETSDIQHHQNFTLSDTMTQWEEDLWLNTRIHWHHLNWNYWQSLAPVEVVSRRKWRDRLYRRRKMRIFMRNDDSESDLNYPLQTEEDELLLKILSIFS